MKEKERKERSRPGRFEPWKALVAEPQLQLTEQPNRERRRGIIQIHRRFHTSSLALRPFPGSETGGAVARAIKGMQNAATWVFRAVESSSHNRRPQTMSSCNE